MLLGLVFKPSPAGEGFRAAAINLTWNKV